MFKRLILEDSAALFTIAAFITAASIYVTFAWRAWRMRSPRLAELENLPFATPTPASRPETSAQVSPAP